MKAIIRNKYGGPEVLKYAEVEKPTASENEVLVKIHATTVNRTDCGGLRGAPFIYRFFIGGLFTPSKKIIGTTFAGEIEAIGKGVNSFEVGDRVFGFHDDVLGTYSQYMCINESKPILKIPEGIDYASAAASPEGTHYAINFINKVKLEKGHKVLVYGATGAIGSAAVQILKYYGIYVIAVGNTKNMDLVKSLGADKVIDYQIEDFTKVGEQFEFVFDAVGKSSYGVCKPLLKDGGIYISSELGKNGENIWFALSTPFYGKKKVIFPLPTDIKSSMELIKKMMEEGKYKPVIDENIYTLKDVAEAFRYVETEQKTGNVVITIQH